MRKLEKRYKGKRCVVKCIFKYDYSEHCWEGWFKFRDWDSDSAYSEPGQSLKDFVREFAADEDAIFEQSFVEAVKEQYNYINCQDAVDAALNELKSIA